MDRTGIDPAAGEDVMFGCVDTVGGQPGDIARTCWLAAGLPEHVPGTTIDRQCGSAQQALHFAAQAVMAGVNDVVVAGGVQQMSMITISPAMTLATDLGFDDPFNGSAGWVKRYGDGEGNQFRGAEDVAAGWPRHGPGTTIARQCGAVQQAMHVGAQGGMAGVNDVVGAGGVQPMSMIPISAAMTLATDLGFDDPFTGSAGWVKRYGDGEVSQFRGAEMIAERWDISRDEMEAFAVESHERAIRARAEGRFESEIAPVGEVSQDEGPREPNWTKIRSLPTLVEGGRVTAAVASQISDASASLLIVSEQALADHGLTSRARIHHMSVRADDPIYMLTAPIPATRYAFEKTGVTMADIDLVEINEAFASAVLAWQRELDVDLAKVNVTGGAIAQIG